MRLITKNSVYEVNPETRTIRRSEPAPGTHHRLADGEPRVYTSLWSLEVGLRPVVVWENGFDGTRLSTLVEVTE